MVQRRIARHGMRLVVTTVSGAILLVSVLGVLIAAYAEGVRCDDSCLPAERASSWSDTADAWQWGVQLVLAIAALLPAAVAFYRSAGGEYRASIRWSVGWAGLAAAWILIHASR